MVIKNIIELIIARYVANKTAQPSKIRHNPPQ